MASSLKRPAGAVLRARLAKLLREAERATVTFSVDPSERAHFIRTRAKRLQSLGRLAPRGREWRASFLPPVRELKEVFADARDAGIVRALAEKYAAGEARLLREALPPDLAAASAAIAAAKAALAAYPAWEGIRWSEVMERAVGTYRAARRFRAEADRARDPDAVFHEWRKRVKRLLYQCEFLGERVRLSRIQRRADRLGEVLGEFQDGVMAEGWLGTHGVEIPPELPARKAVLREKALELGATLFGEKPRDFRERLR